MEFILPRAHQNPDNQLFCIHHFFSFFVHRSRYPECLTFLQLYSSVLATPVATQGSVWHLRNVYRKCCAQPKYTAFFFTSCSWVDSGSNRFLSVIKAHYWNQAGTVSHRRSRCGSFDLHPWVLSPCSHLHKPHQSSIQMNCSPELTCEPLVAR